MVLPVKAELLKLLRKIPLGRVASSDRLASELGVPAPLVVMLMGQLSEDERDLVPWHRVVAKGGAIGRGPHRDQQFARLVREGVMVSPAGIVQDLERHMISGFDDKSLLAKAPEEPSKMGGRSRGMKDRP
ncbi:MULTISPECIES: MGMT family protein [unclassified Hyphomicrobium]|uniref:MGMT family protein n=1 Tax=unclassified Hyphomicrobium TaxID=2619925 RepID=UPI000213E173|nr:MULTISPECIES: MGMT family protein [unclassified Hyphomicrobium]CCB64586.1 Methylated-DNA-(Protein)-cysteine S-methyltransferase DNA binding protein [Hyphomicrobium sp. MC1]